MTKRMLILIAALALVFGTVFGLTFFKKQLTAKFLASYQPPPVTVSASKAVHKAWEQTLHAVGSLAAVNGVDVSAEVGGIVEKIIFRDGQEVKKGDELLRLDDSVEQANLRSLEAQLRLAEINFERDRRLFKTKSISRTDFDKSEAQFKDARAQVERTEVLIQQKLIRAPFTGRVGIELINIGQYVDQGEPLVTLQALDTLYVDFSLPERYVPELARGQTVRCRVDAYPDALFDGQISAINVKVDDNTRSVQVRATLSNRQHELLPGMFVSVNVLVGQPQTLITVPQTAITYSLYGDSIFVIKPDAETDQQVVERRYVKTGAVRDNETAITEGLQSGEQVVTAGQLKLRDGAQVVIDNSVEL